MKISTRILIALSLSLIILSGAIIVLAYIKTQQSSEEFIEKYEEEAYKGREGELREILDIMHQTITSIYKAQVAKGASEKEIKAAILEKLDEPRFLKDKSGYFFVYEYNGTNVLTPTNKSLEGQNLMHLKDSNGVMLIQDLIAAAKKGGGLVRYHFPKVKDGTPLPKFSYAIPFAPYNWMMGTGIYVDDVQNEIDAFQRHIDKNTQEEMQEFLLIALVLIVLSLSIMTYVIRRTISKPLSELLRHANHLSSGNGDLSRKLDIKGRDEIALASESINRFLEKYVF